MADTLGALRTDSRVMEELIARQVHPELDAGELDMLAWVVNKAPVSPDHLAEMMFLPRSVVGEGVAELVRLDLIRAGDPDEEGEIFLTPRPVAVKMVRGLGELTRSALSRVLRDWDDAEILSLADMLDRLVTGLDNLDGEFVDQAIVSAQSAVTQ